jgi:hypothetical protein
MSGVWKRKHGGASEAPGTKGSATDRLHLNHRATPRLQHLRPSTHISGNVRVRQSLMSVKKTLANADCCSGPTMSPYWRRTS